MMTTTPTVAEIAAQSLAAVRVFEKYGIDYCCGGKRPLEEVCREKGIAIEEVTNALGLASQAPSNGAVDWQRAPLTQLMSHIVTTHHEYLKTELPLLHQRVNKVAQVHGGRDASLLEAAQLYGGIRAELEMHLRKEEMILFPAIERYESALENGLPLPRMPFGSLANPIAMMESEHSGAGNALERMRELTDAWQPPSHACATYRAMLSGLQELERDLHTHIHLENNILFPRAIQLEN